MLPLALLCNSSQAQQAVQPYRYFTFDGDPLLKDSKSNLQIDVKRYRAEVTTIDGAVKKGISLPGSDKVILTSSLVRGSQTLAIEFCSRGSSFRYQTLATAHLQLLFAYPYIEFTTTVKAGNALKKDTWKIMLYGSGKNAYDYYADGNWHHFVFLVDARKGIKQLYVDGECPEGFSKTIEKGDQLVFDGLDGFKSATGLDELAFYSGLLPASQIARHAQDMRNGNAYSFSTTGVSKAAGTRQTISAAGVDKLEFAPGYPDYTVQAIDQLKAFPDPRFLAGSQVSRNFPWLDISYLHRELPGAGGKGFGKVNPEKGVEMVEEMITRWNYYLELPVLRVDSVAANNKYSTKGNLEYALINFARMHPEYPTASVIMQVQGKPIQAGFKRGRPFALAQDLADNYYLRDANGKPVLSGKKKWFSPLAPLDYIRDDAATTSFYLRQLTRHLGRPVDMLNDNGELFGHMRPESLLKTDPAVKKDMEARGLSNPAYNGYFQNRLDTCYKNEILRRMGWKNTLFTFYNVSATNKAYWPAYEQRRTSNSVINGMHYATPAFYPRTPANWRDANGPANGYGRIAAGRKDEIAAGDKLFAPFVSAGWDQEEKNVRPAQWLAQLKSMVMLGADFFHVGYFNVTGNTGWPNGAGPNDPRGYAYQVAMPAYAQAIASRIRPFLEKGVLLEPAVAGGSDPYRFKGDKENQLILVRKMGSSYLLYGSIQPNANVIGNVREEETAGIVLDGRTIRFTVRRQGSMYVYDPSGVSPVFYQVDGWHQYQHPWYWTKDILVEAENADKLAAGAVRQTKAQPDNNFSNFETWVNLPSGAALSFDLPPASSNNAVLVLRVRRTGSGDAAIVLEGAKNLQRSVSSDSWTEIRLSRDETAALLGKSGKLTVRTMKGNISLDRILIKV